MTARWMALLVMTRLPAAAVAVLLLVVHRVTAHDEILIAAVLAYTAISLIALSHVARVAARTARLAA